MNDENYSVVQLIMLRKKASEIVRSLNREHDKPLKQAEDELRNAAYVLRFLAEEIFRVYGEIIPLPVKQYESRVVRHLIGFVPAITLWNYPVQLLSWRAGAALAARCTIVAKPPSYTPISPMKFIEYVVEDHI